MYAQEYAIVLAGQRQVGAFVVLLPWQSGWTRCCGCAWQGLCGGMYTAPLATLLSPTAASYSAAQTTSVWMRDTIIAQERLLFVGQDGVEGVLQVSAAEVSVRCSVMYYPSRYRWRCVRDVDFSARCCWMTGAWERWTTRVAKRFTPEYSQRDCTVPSSRGLSSQLTTSRTPPLLHCRQG